MKKFFMVMGMIFCTLLVVGAVGYGVLAVRGSMLDKESRAFAEKAFPELLGELSPAAFVRFLAEEDKMKADQVALQSMFTRARNEYGELKKLGEIKGESNMHFTPDGEVVSAKYLVKAEYEKALVPVQVTLMKREGWSLARIDFGAAEMAGAGASP